MQTVEKESSPGKLQRAEEGGERREEAGESQRREERGGRKEEGGDRRREGGGKGGWRESSQGSWGPKGLHRAPSTGDLC